MTQRKIAVTGARGFIGRNVASRLELSGYEVVRISRVSTALKQGEVSIDLQRDSIGDMGDRLTGVDALVHCAAHVHRPNETPEECRQFHTINVEGTSKLVEACRIADVRRFVFVSSAAVYNYDSVSSPDELSPTYPRSAYARSKLESESVVRCSGLEHVILRLATVFGRGDNANFMKLARAIRRRRFLIPGKGENIKAVISIQDASEIIAYTAHMPGVINLTINVANPLQPTLRQICDGLSKGGGMGTIPTVPLAMFRCAGRLGDALLRVGLNPPITSEVLNKLVLDTRMVVDRMLKEFPQKQWSLACEQIAESATYYFGLE